MGSKLLFQESFAREMFLVNKEKTTGLLNHTEVRRFRRLIGKTLECITFEVFQMDVPRDYIWPRSASGSPRRSGTALLVRRRPGKHPAKPAFTETTSLISGRKRADNWAEAKLREGYWQDREQRGRFQLQKKSNSENLFLKHYSNINNSG